MSRIIGSVSKPLCIRLVCRNCNSVDASMSQTKSSVERRVAMLSSNAKIFDFCLKFIKERNTIIRARRSLSQ